MKLEHGGVVVLVMVKQECGTTVVMVFVAMWMEVYVVLVGPQVEVLKMSGRAVDAIGKLSLS